jgi:hypothetical protein
VFANSKLANAKSGNARGGGIPERCGIHGERLRQQVLPSFRKLITADGKMSKFSTFHSDPRR